MRAARWLKHVALESELLLIERLGNLPEIFETGDVFLNGAPNLNVEIFGGQIGRLRPFEDRMDFVRDLAPNQRHEANGFENLQILVVLGDVAKARDAREKLFPLWWGKQFRNPSQCLASGH